ncbi:MAG: type I-B CRISPR-associated protein Cas8b/Csh1 [Thermoplasmatales archaeon]|nr:type I-B CRISPR-associated protein Cas8b/Csh1 [Thermoplasmatales archaeon]
MLEAVKDIGEYIKNEENIGEEEIFIEANKLSNVKHVICVVFEKKNNKLIYSDTHLEEYEESKNKKYLYRQFSHHLFDLVPTSKTPSLEKLDRRWGKWFKTYANKQNNFWGSDLIKSLHDQILVKGKKELSGDIKGDIKNILDNIPKKERNSLIFTVKIREGNREKYLGDFEIFRKIFVKESIKKFFTRKFDREIKSKGFGTCSLCKREKEVYGFASPFSVYTVKKKGFASNLIQENSWKQLPICEDCGISLQIGKEFINKYLSKNIYAYEFYLVPYFIFGNIQDEIIEEIKDYEKRKTARSLLSLEDDILDIIKENKDIINLIFVFYKRKQGDYFDIFGYVEDVPPSWIKRLFDAFYGIEISIFSEKNLKIIMGEKWAGDLLDGSWNNKKLEKMDLGGFLRTFFPSGYDKYFLSMIGAILSRKFINEDFLINAFIREIRTAHVRDQIFKEKLLCLKSLYLLHFLDDLNLLKVKKMDMKKETKHSHEGKPESFFGEFEKAFNTPEKRAVFLEGVLAKFLLDVQYAQRKSTPFQSKFKGLKLDKSDIKRLFPEIIEKLREYNVAYPWLEEKISRYFIETEDEGWKLSNNDISYYFALGLTLGDIFKKRRLKDD